jgi:molybdopterin molybdotransferase
MIDYQKALTKILTIDKTLNTSKTPLAQALGKTTSSPVTSKVDSPNFNNSAMDGYAIKANETTEASPKNPVVLTVIDTLSAGETPRPHSSTPFSAIEIMTGAMMPDNFDSVIKVEDITKLNDTQIQISAPIPVENNIRKKGEDIVCDENLLPSNRSLAPRHLMALACAGVESVSTYNPLTIAILCTGNEINNDASSSLDPAQLYNSNGPYLKAICESLGHTVSSVLSLPDSEAQFSDAVTSLFSQNTPPDLIITTGGVSAGKLDFIPSTLANLGATEHFHKVKIKPGKPLLFSTLHDTPIFSLPGNPIACVVGFRFFIYPLIRQWHGLPEEKPISALLTAPIDKKNKLRHFLKASLTIQNNRLYVTPLEGQQSFKTKPLLFADCFIEFNENTTQMKCGDAVNVYPIHPDQTFAKNNE